MFEVRESQVNSLGSYNYNSQGVLVDYAVTQAASQKPFSATWYQVWENGEYVPGATFGTQQEAEKWIEEHSK